MLSSRRILPRHFTTWAIALSSTMAFCPFCGGNKLPAEATRGRVARRRLSRGTFILSVTWRPPQSGSDKVRIGQKWVHGFASPPCDGFALSRMRTFSCGDSWGAGCSGGEGTKLRGCGAYGVGHRCKRGVGVGAQGGDRGDAHHDDESQHDGVLDRRWAIFTPQKIDDGC